MTLYTPNHQTRPEGLGIHNWREHPWSQWSFQHVREIVPTAIIPGGRRGPAPLPKNLTHLDDREYALGDEKVTLSELANRTHTDGLIILHNGSVLYEYAAAHFDPVNPHILFSVSKSLTALLAGVLEDAGLFDPNAPVTEYLPAAADSVYGNCSMRNVLDMTVALDFEENYTDPESEYMLYRQATAWNPVDQTNPGPALEEFLYSLRQTSAEHGHAFLYRSPNSDLLGLALERCCSTPYATLFGDKLWCPLGAAGDAEVTVDRLGVARAAGGISVTLEDFARVGMMLANDGTANGNRVISSRWIEDTIHNGDKEAWDRGNYAYKLPYGRYRNKWYQIGDKDLSISARGIHGQLLYVNHKRNFVAARVSSQPDPLNEVYTASMLAAFEQIALNI